MPERPPPRRIAVFHLNQLGDLIFSLPALLALRECFPEARIWSVARENLAPLLSLSGLVDEVIEHRGAADFFATAEKLRALEIDLAVVLSESPRSRLLASSSGAARRVGLDSGPLRGLLTQKVEKRGLPSTANNLRLVRELTCPAERETYVGLLEARSEDRDAARALLEAAGWDRSRHPVVLAPGVSKGRAAKQWSAERFAEVARHVAEHPRYAAVVVGTEPLEGMSAASGVGQIDLCGQTGLADLVGLLSLADLFVGNDSGALHLAASLGTPCVALYGPTDPAETGPHGDHHVVLRAVGGDMSTLASEEVTNAVDRLLASVRVGPVG